MFKRADKVVQYLKDNVLWGWIQGQIDSTLLLTKKDIEILTAFVDGAAPQCDQGNWITYANYAVGYRFCGPAAKCECARQSVSKKVSVIKTNATQEQKDQSLAKRQATNIQRYGIANPLQNVEKIKQSNLKNLGVTNPNKLTRVRNKIRSTCERKYGGPAPACDSSIQDKITQTNLSRYGTASTFENPLIRAKQLSTLVQNYGVEYPIQNPEIAHKIKQTNLSRYGYENASQNPEVIQKIKASQQHTFLDNLITRLEPHKIIPLGQFDQVSNHSQWMCEVCENDFVSTAINGRVPRCPCCYPNHISHPQKEIANYIASLVGRDNVHHNDRKILLDTDDKRRSKEIDITIQGYNLAIEFCGLRWHTEFFGKKHKRYHAQKTQGCQEKNIQLLTIWGDEWESNRSLLKSMIAVRLGLITNKYHARKLKLATVTSQMARLFFDSNHIQGYVNSSQHAALMDGDQIIMCMAFIKSRFDKNYQWELSRMATIKHSIVVGGASRLFSYAKQQLNMHSLISYCDLRYGTGNVYQQLGMTKMGQPTLGYEYVDINNPSYRINRIKLQKHKLGDIGNQSALEYLQSQGIDRLWDCGHQKFVWTA